MAAITAANVQTLYSYVSGSKSDKEVGRVDGLAITLSAQGASLGDIPAALLGFKEIYWAWCYGSVIGGANNSVNVIVDALTGFAALGTNGSLLSQSILTCAAGSATAGNVTGTIFVEVFGRSA